MSESNVRSGKRFLSTPSVRRATPVNGFAMQEFYEISIHALREEGDPMVRRGSANATAFLSTPSVRRATTIADLLLMFGKFLSTPSARRATHPVRENDRDREISIHALREEGDPCTADAGCLDAISIHALREESDGGSYLFLG